MDLLYTYNNVVELKSNKRYPDNAFKDIAIYPDFKQRV